jgi:orotidine-5'-phosphate decarboxylase
MFIRFNKGLIDSLCDIVPAVKPQIAMYEKYGIEGMRAYIETVEYAGEKDLIVIGDIKRGDISSTAAAYAAHIDGTDIDGEWHDLWKVDAVTINPYFGFDGIEPFIAPCNERDKGIFILVKTSNPTSKEIQDTFIAPNFGGFKYKHLRFTNPLLFEKVAFLVRSWGEMAMGRMGYSKVGAVVGATMQKYHDSGEYGELIRTLMPNTFFLIPGYGAQGGKGEDIRRFFDKDGRGCIVNSSRGIMAAYKNDSRFGDHNYGEAARLAAIDMREDITNGK